MPPLQPYIKAISSVENPATPPPENPLCTAQPASFRVLPDTCVELFFEYNQAAFTGRQAVYTGAFVTSRMSRYMDVQIAPGSGSIAVCFYPGTAFPFFPLPMKELTNNIVSLSDIWGHQMTALEDRLSLCGSNQERVSVIQSFLQKQLQEKPVEKNEYAYCLWQIALYKERVPLKTLLKKTTISQRQLNRQFHSFLGLAPKEFARVTRFLHALDKLKKTASGSLTGLAYESGYFDQSHFIHDCKEFAGMTPKEVVRSQALIY